MKNKRIVTIQDISCLGQCSLTVALPIISACGTEACVIPSAVLSTHTGGFSGFTFHDLTEDIPGIFEHWKKEKFTFDAVYTGYLGSKVQVGYVCDILDTYVNGEGVSIIDPAMADRGRLYAGFDREHIEAMKALVPRADYLLPNITEACFLTDEEYTENPDRAFIEKVMSKLQSMGAKNIVLTGESFEEGKTGFVLYDGNGLYSYSHEKIEGVRHGTGDVYASAFTGALMRGKSTYDSARIAADFVVECIKNTDTCHTYGVQFEPVLYKLIEMVK